ncbi:hypothetical protein GCM10007895_21300 [Paraferrimonas sedimenticola]|uniref:Uncharacterized protein n=1 Tax=Paraferrimonas sedimenticola TaxID=375674 RepID=A0AA37RXU7_9GAMM|nr:hypothetical protein GCM10007895_21300 [Paraferrimonas sedimenticola]
MRRLVYLRGLACQSGQQSVRSQNHQLLALQSKNEIQALTEHSFEVLTNLAAFKIPSYISK